MPRKVNKKLDGACRAARAAKETVVVLDNTGSLLGAVDIVTRLVACLHVHTCEEGNISRINYADDVNGSMESETLEEE